MRLEETDRSKARAIIPRGASRSIGLWRGPLGKRGGGAAALQKGLGAEMDWKLSQRAGDAGYTLRARSR
jgi:hypothetical protein